MIYARAASSSSSMNIFDVNSPLITIKVHISHHQFPQATRAAAAASARRSERKKERDWRKLKQCNGSEISDGK
jgi:hypothetical protein